MVLWGLVLSRSCWLVPLKEFGSFLELGGEVVHNMNMSSAPLPAHLLPNKLDAEKHTCQPQSPPSRTLTPFLGLHFEGLGLERIW
eukprot:198815-Amphidinium_carterae.1